MKKTNDYSGEVWKEYTEDIFRDKDVFLISSFGRVIRKKDYDMVMNKEKGYEVKFKRSILNGYRIFAAKERSLKNTTRYVHKVVAKLYLKKKKDDEFVIHLDYEKTNNKVENLKWVDRAGLKEHHKKNPNYLDGFSRRKVRHAKLSEKRVRALRAIVDDPNRTMTYRKIAMKFRITEMQVWRIKNRKNWTHVPEDDK
jgi:DNA invertase Pin-like site-specific DNA recombinase